MDIEILLLNYPSLKEGDSCFTDKRLEHEFLGLTPSPRASHPVVPTVGRFLFRQIQYIMIFFKRQYFFSLTRPYLNLGMEAEASYHAIKAAKKVGGLKRALRATRTLAPAYATYVAGAAGFTYLGKAAYHKAKHLLTKKKKNK